MRRSAALLACIVAVFALACAESAAGPVEEKAPDVRGATIAFVSTRDGSPQIYVAAPDGSKVIRLTSGEAPAWSWDGRRIAFHRGESPAGAAGIYVMNADGTNVRLVNAGANPAWSPDGRIAFNSTIWYPPNDSAGGIFLMNEDGSNVRFLLSHVWARDRNPSPGYGTDAVSVPTWSPDGERIAFWLYAGYSGTHSIGVINADGSEPHDLQQARLIQYSTWGRPMWSPDGSGIVVSRLFHLAIHDAASGLGKETFAGGMFPESPDWSPDGSHIVFAGQWSRVSRKRIYIVNVETGVVQRLIHEAESPALTEYEDYSPAWSRVRE